MKYKISKIIYLFLVLILFASFANAIPNLAQAYCVNMGYESNLDNSKCIFNDKNECPLWEFYEGKCGKEYVHTLECKQLGGRKGPGFECCEGLVSASISSKSEEGICQNMIGGWPVCIACGDGICAQINPELYGEWENECNCSSDCEFFETSDLNVSIMYNLTTNTSNYDLNNITVIYNSTEINETENTSNQTIDLSVDEVVPLIEEKPSLIRNVWNFLFGWM